MSDLVAALGLVLVIEGLLYALAPSVAKRIAEEAQRVGNDTLRTSGLVAVGLGVGLVWLVRG